MKKAIKKQKCKQKIESSSNTRFSNQNPLRRRYKPFKGGFYYRPVLTFNVDSLSKSEQREITKIFWSEYDK